MNNMDNQWTSNWCPLVFLDVHQSALGNLAAHFRSNKSSSFYSFKFLSFLNFLIAKRSFFNIERYENLMTEVPVKHKCVTTLKLVAAKYRT